MNRRRRFLPSVDAVKQMSELASLMADNPERVVTTAIRNVVESLRRRLSEPETPTPPLVAGKVAPAHLAELVARETSRLSACSLVPVINATGVVIHTNLGRAPLGRHLWRRMAVLADGYSNLEYHLEAGGRGSRHQHLERFMKLLTGAPACCVVNNNAAAVLLVLTALARGREVVVSRSELIEIGGSFRLPEIMAQGGAILREVGTTNRTRLVDYEKALSDETGLLLKAHRSNFAVVGFTEEVSRRELADLAGRRAIPFYEDLGSGLMCDLTAAGVDDSHRVSRALEEGADLVSFSGDKMLGGPQAGVILGREEYISTLKAHPLTRALRPDKLTLAGLEAVTLSYLSGRAAREIPVVSMLTEPVAGIRDRATQLARQLSALPGAVADVVDCAGRVGGGAEPEARLESAGVALALAGHSETRLAARLRTGTPAVVVRTESGRCLLDCRTVRTEEIDGILGAVKALLQG